MGSKVLLLVLSVVRCGASMECYKCTDTFDPAACDITKRCYDGQVCFQNSTTSGQSQVTSLGCIDNQHCGAHSNIQSPIVGREINTRQAGSCFECCSTDQCNKHLCHHLRPSACTDDESVDCAKMNTLFTICTDIDHAKKVCPKFCGLCNVVDGSWSLWSEWTQCDVTCENGTQIRTRLCNNPLPQNGGRDCLGNKMLTKSCLRELCPVHGGWSSWEAWRSCSVTCDIGLQSRTRNCSNPVPERNGQHCFGHNFDVRQCMPGACANGGWSVWGSWNPCSVTCGVGVRLKSRSCTNPPPSPFGQYCIGEQSQMESCTRPECDSSRCQPDPCENGMCIDMSHDFLCLCHEGFEGRYCNESSSACKSNPCLHGKCYDNDQGFICVCDDGYNGKLCNMSIDHCLSSPCLKGICTNTGANFTCICPPGVTGSFCQTIPASDCHDILKMNLGMRTGIYWVKSWKSREKLEVLCDLETADGGWTVFQLRVNGSLDFYRNFANYTGGFGNVHGEFWLGLHNIYEMASQGQSELRIDLEAADGTMAYELFQDFALSPGPDYTLHISKGTGTAGDGGRGLSYNNGYTFSTYDHGVQSDCASSNDDNGGWWYNGCTHVNLNGKYVTPGTKNPLHAEGGVIYRDFQGEISLKQTKMMLRRIS